jgi:hypothetical protein
VTSTRDSEIPAPSDPEPASATKALVALGTLVVLGAIVWGTSALVRNDSAEKAGTFPATTGQPLTPWRPTDPAEAGAGQTPGVGPAPSVTDRPVVLFDGPLTIASGLGVDVDRSDAADPGQGTATRDEPEPGVLDVYWDQKNGLSVNDGSLYVDQGLPAGAAERCAARVAANKDGSPALAVFPGDQFCLRTSDGRIAWLRVGEGAAKDTELAVQVTVWDGVPG